MVFLSEWAQIASAQMGLWDPFINLWHAVTRKGKNGVVVEDSQGITIEGALKCYTINNARSTLEEDVKDSIESEKYVDFVVIEDPLTCPIEVKDMKVLMMVVGGKITYEIEDTSERKSTVT